MTNKSFVYMVLESLAPVLSMMPLTAKTRPTWSLRGEVRLAGLQEGKTSLLSTSPILNDPISDAKTSENFLPEVLLRNGNEKQVTSSQSGSDQWSPLADIDSLGLNDNTNPVNESLSLWRIRTLLSSSSPKSWKPIDEDVFPEQTQTMPHFNNQLRTDVKQSNAPNQFLSYDAINAMAAKQVLSSQLEKPYELPYDSKLAQFKSKTNTPMCASRSVCPQPYVYRVSAKISPMSSKLQRNGNDASVPTSPSDIKHIYFSLRNPGVVPQSRDKYVQTDSLPISTRRRRLISSSPVLTTTGLKSLPCKVRTQSDGMNLQKSPLKTNLDKQLACCNQKLSSDVFLKSESSSLLCLVNSDSETKSSESISNCNSNGWLDVSNATEQKYLSDHECRSSSFRIPTKCQLTQTSKSNVTCRPIDEMKHVTQVTQTDDRDLENAFKNDDEHKLFSFYLAFRFAYFLLTEKNQESIFCDSITQGTQHNRYSFKWLHSLQSAANVNECETASHSMARLCNAQRSNKRYNSKSKCPRSTLVTTDPHDSRLWYNRSYRKRPPISKSNGGKKQHKIDDDFIPRQTRTYRRRKLADNYASGQSKWLPQHFDSTAKDTRLSSCSSSENDRSHSDFTKATLCANKGNCNYAPGVKPRCKLETLMHYRSKPISQPRGKSTRKDCLHKMNHFESSRPTSESCKPLPNQLVEETESMGKKLVHKTLQSWASSRDKLVKLLHGEESEGGCQRHISSSSITKLLFRKCQSLSSGTLHGSKFDQSSSSTSAMTSDPLMTSATCLSLQTGKSHSNPQRSCDSALLPVTTKSSEEIPSVQVEFEKGMQANPATDDKTNISCPDQAMYRGLQSTACTTKMSNAVVPFSYTESSPCFTESLPQKHFISIPCVGEAYTQAPSTNDGNPSTQPELIVEQFPIWCFSSPDRVAQFHSDSIVAWASGKAFPLTNRSERWPAQSDSQLEGRLSGGSDRGTASRMDEAEDHGCEQRDPVIENPILDCDSSGTDQTVVYTCNECCKSCASTTGWSCQTNNYGSGIFIPSTYNPTVCDERTQNPIQRWEVFPGSTRHCTSTYQAKGKCEIPEIEDNEDPPRTEPNKNFAWIDNDPFVSNESCPHEIPVSYDYSHGPNSFYRTGRTSLAAGGQPNRPVATIGCNVNNCGQWWHLPSWQNGWNMNTCYEQESTGGWPPVGRWQGWGRNSDWWSQQKVATGPEQTWTSPQHVFMPNENRRRQTSPISKDDKPRVKRRPLIQPSVRKPRLRPCGNATVRDCGSQVNTLLFEDDETPVSRCESPPRPEGCCSPVCYHQYFDAGVVFDCSTQTNISKIEKQTDYTPIVHYNVREPPSPPLYEANNFIPSPTRNVNCSSLERRVCSPSPMQTTSCPSPVQNVRVLSPEPNRSCPSPVQNVRFLSPEQNASCRSPIENNGFSSPEQSANCSSPVQTVRYASPVESVHYSSAPNTRNVLLERNEPRTFHSAPCPAPNPSEQLPPCASTQQWSEEQPSEGHDCPQESKSGLVTDVMRSVQGFRNCLNCGTNQNVHYNRKGVYAVRVISNGKESQNKTNQCVHYKWLPSLPWPEPTCEPPCDSEVYYDSRTSRSSNEEPVEEKQDSVSWKKEFRRRSAVNSDFNKRAAGGGGGSKQALPQEELLSVHSNSHQWGSSYGQMFDVSNCMQKDLKRRRGPPLGVPELREHELCSTAVAEEENEENSTAWTQDSDGEDIYSYYHRYNNHNEANCDLVEEHDEVYEINRHNDLPSTVTTYCQSSVEDEPMVESMEECTTPTEMYAVTERVHQKTPTKRVQFMEVCCETPDEEEPMVEETAEQMSTTPTYTVLEHVCHNTPTKKTQFEEHCCKATQIPTPTYDKCQQFDSQMVEKSPQTEIKTCPENQPDTNITDICITGPSRAITYCNRCGGSCRPTRLRRNGTCRVRSVVCACSDNNPPNIDCLVECGCSDNPPNYTEAYNNYCCGCHYSYPNYMPYGCYCCPLMHYHSMACYVVPPTFGQPLYEIQNPLPSQTPTPAKFKDSYKPEDWTPPLGNSPEPEEASKADPIKPLVCPDENTTFALRCKHRRMNESPSGKITLHDCEVSEDSRRFIPGLNCTTEGQKKDCCAADSQKTTKRSPKTAHASTSGCPLLEVLAQNEEVIRAAKDCLQRTVNYISVAKGSSRDDLYPRRKNSPGNLLPDYWAMKTGLYQRCQLIDKISGESINLDLPDDPPAAQQSCLPNSMNINEKNVDSVLLLDPCDVPRDPCHVTESRESRNEDEEKECRDE